MSDRQVRIVISGEAASLIRAAQQSETALRRVGSAGSDAGEQTQSFGDRLKQAAATAGVVTGFAAVTAAIGFVVKTGVSFQDSMNQLKAVTQSSDTQMASMSETARALGSDITIPGTSASDAAGAMLELAKGGLTAQDAMEAARGTLILAAAAGESGAEAAEMQAAALNTFGLSADQAGRVANTLANAANSAAGEITDFSSGLAQTGTVASSFGWTLEETTSMLGLMANAGIKGSDAGTSLKTTLTAMLSPTKQQAAALEELGIKTRDANGNMISAQSLTEQLAAAKGRMSEADFTAAAATAFGTDAVRTALVAANAGAEGYDKMADSLGNASGAQDVATAKTQGVSGAFGEMMSQVEDVSLSLFDKFAPALQGALGIAASLVAGVGNLVGWFGQLPAPIQAGAAALAALILLKGPILGLWTAMKATGVGLAIQGEMLAAKLSVQSLRIEAAMTGGSMGVLGAGMRVAGIAAVGLGNSLKAAFLSNPIGIALVVATTALTAFMSATGDAEAATSDLTSAIDAQTGALTENAAREFSDAAAKSGASAAYKKLGGNVADYIDAMGGVPGAQEKVTATIDAARVAYQKHQDAVAAAATGQGNFGSGAAQTADQLGGLAPSIFDVNKAAEFLANTDSTLDGKQKEVALSGEGMKGALGGVGGAAAAAAPDVDALAEAMKTAIDNAQFMAQNTTLAATLSGVATTAADADRAVNFLSLRFEELAGRNMTAEEAAARMNEALRGVESAFKDGTKAATENAEAGNLNMQALSDWDVTLLTATTDGAALYSQLTDLVGAHAETTASAYLNALATGDVAGANGVARKAADDSREAFLKLTDKFTGNREESVRLADKLGVLEGVKIDDKEFETILQDAVANGKLTALQAQQIRDKQFAIDAVDRASAVMAQIAAQHIADKQFQVTQINRVINAGGTASVGNGLGITQEDGGVVHAARGLMVSGRGTSQVRDGSGPGLTWAEKATNKEYYLSMKTGMESRNRGLAAAAVNELGGRAVWGSGRAADVRSGSFTPPASQGFTGGSGPMRIEVSLSGDGVVTGAMAQVAQVTVNGVVQETRMALRRQGSQG